MYAGIILHDIGKVIELSGPVGTQYTVEGNLIGHISIMVNEISKAADELEISGEEVMLFNIWSSLIMEKKNGVAQNVRC